MRRKNIYTHQNKRVAALRPTLRQLRLLGFLPFSFFSAQAIHYWQIGQLGHTLWMCNIGNLLLALGLFLGTRELIRVAVLWMVPGVAVWFFYVVPTWGMLFSGSLRSVELFGVLSSTLAHLGGFAVGMFVLRKVGMEGRAWFYAFIWYFIVQLVSRMATPAELNVNVAHRIQPGWEQTFSSYGQFWFVLSTLVGLCLYVLGRLLHQIWPVSPRLDREHRSPPESAS